MLKNSPSFESSSASAICLLNDNGATGLDEDVETCPGVPSEYVFDGVLLPESLLCPSGALRSLSFSASEPENENACVLSSPFSMKANLRRDLCCEAPELFCDSDFCTVGSLDAFKSEDEEAPDVKRGVSLGVESVDNKRALLDFLGLRLVLYGFCE